MLTAFNIGVERRQPTAICDCGTLQEKRLIVMSLPLPSKKPVLVLAPPPTGSDGGDNFCSDAKALDAPFFDLDLTIGHRLEALIADIPRSVKLCMELTEKGSVKTVRTKSASLSRSDEKLISDYIQNHWNFADASIKNAGEVAGKYRFRIAMGIR